MKRFISTAIACFSIGSSALQANPAFDPSKVVIIKADDYSGDYNSQQQKWTDFVTASRNLGIKVSLGVVPASVPAGNAAALWMQQQQAFGDVEFWNHGWDHSRDSADPPAYWEFRNTGLAFQQTHFADAQAWLLAATGRASVAFGAPYNQTDADTVSVMNTTPAIRLFFTYNGATARSQGLVTRVHTVGIIAESGGTGKPVASTFVNTYPNGPAGPVSLQFHPAVFTAADLAEYVRIVQFLQGKGYSFLLPSEYAAAAVPEGAKVWTGASDANWTTAANWSPGGAPASGADVAFGGSGANLNTNFNSTGFTLNSLAFTAGQATAVTINTTTAAPLTLNPGAVLGVVAGSHRLIGTGTGSSGTSRDLIFAGTAGTHAYSLSVASEAGFEIRGRIGATGTGANTRTYTKTGAGTLIFSGNSGGGSAWQHGGLAIQQGVLRFAESNAGGNSANNYSISGGAALELDGNFTQTINNGTYTLNGNGISGKGALRSLAGTKSIAGTGTGGINLATNASIGVDAGNLTIAHVVKGSGSLTKVGSGTLTLSGANTYTGATVVSSGTLALGASNVLPASQVSVGAATLSVGAGFTETTGRLNITETATLNLGSDSSTIAFADNGDLLDWTGTLNITGSFVPNVSVRFGTTSSGLTAAQLAKITVNGTGGYTLDALGYLGEPKHYDVYLIAGQSNADGRGANSDLTGPLAPYAGPQSKVPLFYVNPNNSTDSSSRNYNTGWTTLAPGFSVAPGFSGALPSNTFGFELSLAKALAAKDPSRNVALIKVTRGGTNLANDWDPAGGANYMWQGFANAVPAAMAALTATGDTAEIRGMFWHQGESDGGNATYQSDLVAFIAACRTLTGKPNLPFLIGELERDNVTPTVTGRTNQLTAMANVAAADPNTLLVSSADLLTSDGTHFTSSAYVTFGERFAKAYHDFLNVTVLTRFETWAGDGEVTFTGDANGDGIADGLAWLLGAGSPAANATALLPSPVEKNGAVEVTFAMRNQSTRGAAVMKLQHGTTLGSWTTVTIPDASGTHDGVAFSITPSGEISTVVATIPGSFAPDGRFFIRLSGAEN